MGLETVTYIDDLNPLWPLGGDYVDSGDNHIRNIKAAILATFPNLTGPVTVGQGVLNNAALESGTVALFFQAAAPTGWTRESTGDSSNPWMPVIAKDGGAGASAAGSHSPIINDKISSHTHAGTVTVNSGGASHSHSFKLNGSTSIAGVPFLEDNRGAGVHAVNGMVTSVAAADNVFTVADATASHSHTASTSISANAGADDWEPLHYTGILCSKD